MNFNPSVFCGILAEWLSNTREIQTHLAWYAGKRYTGGPLKSKEVMAELIAVPSVMVSHAEKKLLV